MSNKQRQPTRKPAPTSTHPDALYRLLRALASRGIFAEAEPRRFSITPLAEFLQSDVAGSKRALALISGDEQFRALRGSAGWRRCLHDEAHYS